MGGARLSIAVCCVLGTGSTMKIISFSLWGDSPKYVVGALRNAALAPRVYPGWTCRFHCGTSVPRDAVDRLSSSPGVEVVRHDTPGDWTAMLWRFADIADERAEVVIVRDADSRLNARERAAVEGWLASGREAHVMRDHPAHNRPILGGMWGARRGALPEMAALLTAVRNEDRYQVDQDFLQDQIWPRLRGRCVEHDEYYGGEAFPTWRSGTSFVGQPFDEHDRALIHGPTAAARLVRQTVRRVAQVAGLRGAPIRLAQ